MYVVPFELSKDRMMLMLYQNSTVGIYGQNCENWLVSEQACYQQNFIVVSIYDTLGTSLSHLSLISPRVSRP